MMTEAYERFRFENRPSRRNDENEGVHEESGSAQVQTQSL